MTENPQWTHAESSRLGMVQKPVLIVNTMKGIVGEFKIGLDWIGMDCCC